MALQIRDRVLELRAVVVDVQRSQRAKEAAAVVESRRRDEVHGRLARAGCVHGPQVHPFAQQLGIANEMVRVRRVGNQRVVTERHRVAEGEVARRVIVAGGRRHSE